MTQVDTASTLVKGTSLSLSRTHFFGYPSYDQPLLLSCLPSLISVKKIPQTTFPLVSVPCHWSPLSPSSLPNSTIFKSEVITYICTFQSKLVQIPKGFTYHSSLSSHQYWLVPQTWSISLVLPSLPVTFPPSYLYHLQVSPTLYRRSHLFTVVVSSYRSAIRVLYSKIWLPKICPFLLPPFFLLDRGEG